MISGYNFNNGISPEIGTRYILIDQDEYSDGVQNIKADENDVLTAVAGIKYSTCICLNNRRLNPTARIAATYDLVSDDSIANVNIINGSNYQVVSKKLNRFGIEAGLGLNTQYNNIDSGIEFLGNYRKDYQNHSGVLN